MKFPRNARIFRGQLDAAPLALVFFLLVIFLMLGSLVYTPGVRLQLPVTEGLPGMDRPSVSVAIDASGRVYYQNQVVAKAPGGLCDGGQPFHYGFRIQAQVSDQCLAAGQVLGLGQRAEDGLEQGSIGAELGADETETGQLAGEVRGARIEDRQGLPVM